VISDEFGVFVAPTGDDRKADGTQALPFATVSSALLNMGTMKRVYVCAADYIEPAAPIEIPDRVSIYGGFTCAEGNWAYGSSIPAHLMPQSPIGAMITDAKVGVVIQDVRIDAGDAADGASSFGLVLRRSQNIALRRVDIRAGKGGKGSAGADGTMGVDGLASGPEQNGKAGTCSNAPLSQVGPVAVSQLCGSQGGMGGTAFVGTVYSSLQDGGGGALVTPSNGGKGGDVLGKRGDDGKAGDAGVRGEVGAAAAPLGTFSENGYLPASGGGGGAGKSGAGGGGGGASLGTASCLGATGGAGGMGGCGGDPGGGGQGGGASVALFSWQSSVSIESCTLVANTGGAGGDGGTAHIGGAGKAGGTGGPTDSTNKVGVGGRGGDGGNGGNGGNGAGGTGGPSIALVYEGTAPVQIGPPDLRFSMVAATAGKGGKLGSMEDYGPDGAKGLTQGSYQKL
jgi:hypothetical protein